MQHAKHIFWSFLVLILIGAVNDVLAQRHVIQMEGYFHGIDHRAFLLNSDKTCDSLDVRDKYGVKPQPDELICYATDYTGESEFSIYQREGVMLCIDSNGNFYSKDMYGSYPPFYLNINLEQLVQGRKDIVLEVDDYGYDSLVVKTFPLKNYVLGKREMKGMQRLAIYYNNFTYPARGELSPEVMEKLKAGTYIEPEDGKIESEFTLFLPIDDVPIDGNFTFYIYDLSGNIIKMMTGLNKKENLLTKENLTPGTYRYAIYFNKDKIVKKGMIYFKEAAKPE